MDYSQKSHIEKELLSHLDGIKTVFDGGAGYRGTHTQLKLFISTEKPL